ncbi:hypothetical protein CTAYLR_007913 [Chrysophaeum taylorii]|uniref:Prefoldin subunit 6 n=1 Tax=Chrysophaeum taylorii TaxID=2483200 RepID=A0AAD7XIF2_9STRA|nr:hypothetical protein CTAYLR_007913 [Chrysophaeum taylorii]
MSEEDMAQYRGLQAQMQQLLQTRAQFAQQDTENQMVRKELEIAGEEATVYKLVGPLLLKQEMVEVKENVGKRLEFIAGEIEKVDRQLETKQKEQKALSDRIVAEQKDMRARAADEARKVFEQQTAAAK